MVGHSSVSLISTHSISCLSFRSSTFHESFFCFFGFMKVIISMLTKKARIILFHELKKMIIFMESHFIGNTFLSVADSKGERGFYY